VRGNSTTNRAMEIVRRILHLARDEWLWIQRFPRIRMLKEPKRRICFLTRDESERLLEALPAHLVPVIRFALATGCRMNAWKRLARPGNVPWRERIFRISIFTTCGTAGQAGMSCKEPALQELMELGGWKSYEMVLRYAHRATVHLAEAAARIESRWEP
jgi:hypothetical protein